MPESKDKTAPAYKWIDIQPIKRTKVLVSVGAPQWVNIYRPPHTKHMALTDRHGFSPANYVLNGFNSRPICKGNSVCVLWSELYVWPCQATSALHRLCIALAATCLSFFLFHISPSFLFHPHYSCWAFQRNFRHLAAVTFQFGLQLVTVNSKVMQPAFSSFAKMCVKWWLHALSSGHKQPG